MQQNNLALQSLRREIDVIRDLIKPAEISAVKRYYSSYLLPPSGNIPRGSTDEDRICVKDEWNGQAFQLTTTPTILPGTHLQKIRLNSLANGITIRIKFVTSFDNIINDSNGIATFRMSWKLARYEGTSLISATTGDRPITKKVKSDDGFRMNDSVEQEFSFQYITWDGSTSPGFDGNGDLPIKGYPSGKHVELDVSVKGVDYGAAHNAMVFVGLFETLPSSWGWIDSTGTVNSSQTSIVAPSCEIIEF